MKSMNNKAVMNTADASPKRGTAAPLNFAPPPPNFLGARRMVKHTWLLCLFLFGIIALPVQSQTLLPLLTNPTAANLAPCGLPSQRATFNASASVKTFNMTADCVFSAGTFDPSSTFLRFTAGGTFIINGNGHSISGPNDLIHVLSSNATLNLNDVIIRQTGRSGNPIIRAHLN